MDLYLAGGITGNLFPLWRKLVNGGGYNEYLSCWGASREKRESGSHYRGGYNMNLFIAGTMSRPYVTESGEGFKILESFYYCRDNEVIPKLLPILGDFLLDSGAFSFMQGKGAVDWDQYTEEYAEWINRYGITKFFELDIDSIVGLREVERLRAKLERLTGKQPIPVWHISRGKDYFLEKMCKEYPYVALGGIVGANKGSLAYKQYQAAFPWFIREAHKAGAKIHGLGFTSIAGLKKYHFDSVDSTAWLYGNRGGYLYRFNPTKGGFDKIPVPAGHRLSSQEAAKWNFTEWIKFQRYAEKYL